MIYLAGPCDIEHRTLMTQIANTFRAEGQRVYCPWEHKIENAWNLSQEEWARQVFKMDLRAIEDSNVVVLISTGRQSTAGTNFENGYAYALGKPIHIIQITDAPASLMTYCGCTTFIVVREKEIQSRIKWIADCLARDEQFFVKRTSEVVLA